MELDRSTEDGANWTLYGIVDDMINIEALNSLLAKLSAHGQSIYEDQQLSLVALVVLTATIYKVEMPDDDDDDTNTDMLIQACPKTTSCFETSSSFSYSFSSS